MTPVIHVATNEILVDAKKRLHTYLDKKNKYIANCKCSSI